MKPLIATLLMLPFLIAIAVRAADETDKTSEFSQTQSATATAATDVAKTGDAASNAATTAGDEKKWPVEVFRNRSDRSAQSRVQRLADAGVIIQKEGDAPQDRDQMVFNSGQERDIDNLLLALERIARFEHPPIELVFRFSPIRELESVPQPAAKCTFNWSTSAAVTKQVLESLNQSGIATFAAVRPRTSLWVIRPSLSGLPESELKEFQAATKSQDLSKSPDAPTIDALIPDKVAVVYHREQAGWLLKWLLDEKLVLERSEFNEDHPWKVEHAVEVQPDSPGSNKYARLSGNWSWSASIGKDNMLQVNRTFRVVEHWQGEAQPRPATNEVTSSFGCKVEPGSVVFMNALAVTNFGVSPSELLPGTGKSYFPLLVVETRAVETDQQSPLEDAQTALVTEPKGATPIEQLTNTGYGNRARSSGPLIAIPTKASTESIAAQSKSSAAPGSDSGTTVGESRPKAYEPLKLIVTNDGGAQTDADRDRIRKLIEEGILTQQDKNALVAAGASLVLQPKFAANEMPSSIGGLRPSDAAALNPAWDTAIRRLHSALANRPSGSWHANDLEIQLTDRPRVADADARLIIPEMAADELAELVINSFRDAGLVAEAEREHPVFVTVPWKPGRETFAVYANESGSPTRILKGAKDSVDVRFSDEDLPRLPAEIRRSRVVLEKQPVQLLHGPHQTVSKQRIVGIDVTREEASLLRAAERLGRIEVVRRDPQDATTRVTAESLRQLRDVLDAVAAAPPSKAAPPLEQVSDRATTARSQVPPSVAEAATNVPASTAPTFKVFKLHNADAVSQANLLSQIIRKKSGFVAVADARTNSVLVTADNETTELVEAILAKLDSEPTKSRPVAVASAGSSAGTPIVRGAPVRPAAELQQTYNDREAAAAKLAKQLRDLSALHQAEEKPKADSDEEARLKKELSDAVKKSFEARQELLKAELDNLQSRIAEAQKSLDTRDKAADAIIDRRVQDLLNPEFKWDEPSAKTSEPAAATGTATANPFGPPPLYRAVVPSSSPFGASARIHAPVNPTYVPGDVAVQPVPAKAPSSTSVPMSAPAAPARTGGAFGGSSIFGRDRRAASPSTPQNLLPRTIEADGLVPLQLQGVATELGLESWTYDGRVFQGRANDEQFKTLQARIAELKSFAEEQAAAAEAKRREMERQQLLDALTGVWVATKFKGDGDKYPDLVIDHDQAADFNGNELTRRWKVDVGPMKPETWVRLIPQDGKSGLEAILDWNSLSSNSSVAPLKFVIVGKDGLTETDYSRQYRIIPSEWAARLHESDKKPASQFKPISELIHGTPGAWTRSSSGAGFASIGSAPTRSESRNPSDYLELLQKYQALLANYDSGISRLGQNDPLFSRLQKEREEYLRPMRIIQLEFQLELENAARAVELKSVALSDANTAFKNTKRLVDKGLVSQAELSKYENALKSAEIELQNAQARLKLFESTKDSLFAQPTQEPQPATQPGQQKSPEQPARPTTATAPAAPSPTAAPSTHPDEFRLPPKAPATPTPAAPELNE